MRGNEVLRQFDLVAANSGGSIVLGGLVEDVTLQELLNYFMDPVNRNAIFSPTSSVFDRTLEGLLGFGPKYSAAAKLPALETLLPQTGNVKLQGINNNLAGYNGTMYETAVAQIVLSSQNRIPVLAAQHVGNGGTLSLNERRDVIAALLAEPISPALTDKVRSI
jgi:hypothetical protein